MVTRRAAILGACVGAFAQQAAKGQQLTPTQVGAAAPVEQDAFAGIGAEAEVVALELNMTNMKSGARISAIVVSLNDRVVKITPEELMDALEGR